MSIDKELQEKLNGLERAYLDSENDIYAFEAILHLITPLSKQGYSTAWIIKVLAQKYDDSLERGIERLLIGCAVNIFSMNDNNSINKAKSFISEWFNISEAKTRNCFYYFRKLIKNASSYTSHTELHITFTLFEAFMNKMLQKMPHSQSVNKEKILLKMSSFQGQKEENTAFDKNMYDLLEKHLDKIVSKLGYQSQPR